MTPARLASFLAVGFLVLFTACQEKTASWQKLTGQSMGTTWSLKYSDDSTTSSPIDLQALLETELDQLTQTYSHWQHDSMLSEWNANTSTAWQAVSKECVDLLRLCQDMHQFTDGYFDPSLLSITEELGFVPRLSQQQNRASSPASGSMMSLEIDETNSRLRKSEPTLRLDLSAILKGHAIDRIRDLLLAQGLQNFLLEFGGEIATRGTSPLGQAWKIGITHPTQAPRIITKVALDNQSLATSGNYYQRQGNTHHLIDPKTAQSASNHTLSVSVLHESCAYADALATALAVMPTEKALEFCHQHNIAALLITQDSEDKAPKLQPSTAWPQQFKD